MKSIAIVMNHEGVTRSGKPASNLAHVLKTMMIEGVLTWCSAVERFPKEGTYFDDTGCYVHPRYLLQLLHQVGYSGCTPEELETALLADKLIVTGPRNEAGVLLRIRGEKAMYPAYWLHMANIYDAASYIENAMTRTQRGV